MKDKDFELQGWTRCVSVRVSRGGKRHFWYRRNPHTDQREWYVFMDGKWHHKTDEG